MSHQKNKKRHSGDVSGAISEEKRTTYFGSAVITLIFYLLFWPAGFVLNFVYLKQAERTESLIGRQPDGKGCLSILLIVLGWIPIALAVFAIIFLLAFYS